MCQLTGCLVAGPPTHDVSATRDEALGIRGFLIAQRFEACANLFTEELRLLKRGEVPALREPVVVDQLRIRTFGPAPRSRIEFIRKNAHRNRDGDALGAEIAALAPEFPVETGARNRRVREPGDRDVVENVVAREALRVSVEDARDELQAARIVIEEVRRQADGRIRDAGGASTPIRSVMTAPQSPPCATYFVYPRRFISSTHARAIRSGPQPVPVGLPEKP